MSFLVFFIILGISFILFSVIHKINKSKRPVKRALISMLSGAASMAVVDLLAGFTGVYIPISLLSIAVSLILGVPGVTALLAVNLFF